MAGRVLYRLRCGHRVWSRWLNYEDQAWQVAIDKGLASEDARTGRLFPGPLMWIEKGYRARPRQRTVPMTAELDGRPLARLFRNPLPGR